MTAPETPPLLRIVSTTVHGRCLVRPAPQAPAPGWLIGFHGYGQNAELFLESLARIPAARTWLVASVQGLHPFYTRTNDVVANWMTKQDREHAIPDNIAYVDAVVADLALEFGPPARLVYAGFSQGVAMAYRAAVLGARPAAAVFAAGGDVPPELGPTNRQPWPPVVLCAGTGDTFYPPSRMEAEAESLRALNVNVRTMAFEGGHEWSEAVVEAADRLLEEIVAAPHANIAL